MSRSWIGKLDLCLIVLIVVGVFIGELYIIFSKDNYKDSYAQFTEGENVIEYSIEYKFGPYYRLSNDAWVKVDNTTVVEHHEEKEVE